MVESTSAYKMAAHLAIATPPPAYVLSRDIDWQGVCVFINGLYGTCTGLTVSVENVGLLGLTRVGSRRVIQTAAGFMILFSIFVQRLHGHIFCVVWRCFLTTRWISRPCDDGATMSNVCMVGTKFCTHQVHRATQVNFEK
ncbi:hypothetical protein ACS0TY_036899 [Phlomoides rotata]